MFKCIYVWSRQCHGHYCLYHCVCVMFKCIYWCMGQCGHIHYYIFMPAVILMAVVKNIDYLVQEELIWVAYVNPCLRMSGKPIHSEWRKVITILTIPSCWLVIIELPVGPGEGVVIQEVHAHILMSRTFHSLYYKHKMHAATNILKQIKWCTHKANQTCRLKNVFSNY